MRKYAVLLLTGVVLCASCPTNSGGKYEPARFVRSAIPADFMGMVHAGDRNEVAAEYALLDELGVEWMLTDFSWSRIQTGPNTWNLDAFKTYADNGESHGKKILAILDYDVNWIHNGTHEDDPYNNSDPSNNTPAPYISPSEISSFCDYVTETVKKYKDRVDAWCIWNEPNLADRFWAGTPEEFFNLTKAAAAAIRDVDPDAFIIGGALNTLADEAWMRGLFTSGAMDDINAVAYHPYMPSPGPTVNVFNNFKHIASEYGFGDKIWVTEVGYPSYSTPTRPAGRYGTDVHNDHMPETVMETIILLAANGADRLFWYELFDHGDPGDPGVNMNYSEHWFGMVKGGDNAFITGKFEKRPWAYAYQLAAQNIPGTVCHTPVRDNLPVYIQAYHFTDGGGKNVLVVWNEVISPKEVQVYLPGTNQQVYNIETGAAEPIGMASTYTLKAKTGSNAVKFFTWENAGSAQPPRVYAP